ncbi:hypothetical protein ACLMJK_000423 [Lecanora helva]
MGTQQNLNMTAQAVFGNDTLGLGVQGSGGPTLPDSIIGAYSSQVFYVGLFGVNPRSTNFTPEDQGRPSYISTLKNQSLIPSLSAGYTAGAQYRLKSVLGSLTLGGVDSARYAPNNLSIPFASDPSRDLMVSVQSIKSVDQSGKSTDLLPSPIMTFVDTAAPQIWLPLEACQVFEKTFGLTYDETSGLYLVNSSLRDQLHDQNASFTFTLGSTATGGQTTDITLPYASFDMLVKPPTNGIANSSRYFPLRRAANDSQYTLGRAFLQEAYLTVDWERQNFSLSQCTFNEDMTQSITPIKSLDDKTSSSSSSGGSSTGRTAGIAVGVVVGVLVVASAIGAFFFFRNRKQKKSEEKKDGANPKEDMIRQGFGKAEMGTEAEHERFEMDAPLAEQSKPEEQQMSEWVNEKANYPGHPSDVAEADNAASYRPELGSHQRGPLRPLHEMQDPSVPPAELPGTQPEAPELHGSQPTSAASSPGLFARRSRRSNAGSPVSHTSSTRRRSLMERLGGRPSAAPRSPTSDSVPSIDSATIGAPAAVSASPSPHPHPHPHPQSPPQRTETPPVGHGHSGEPFSPISRADTFSPDPISRQGTFTPDNASVSGANSNPFSPVSPSSPETHRGAFGRF